MICWLFFEQNIVYLHHKSPANICQREFIYSLLKYLRSVEGILHFTIRARERSLHPYLLHCFHEYQYNNWIIHQNVWMINTFKRLYIHDIGKWILKYCKMCILGHLFMLESKFSCLCFSKYSRLTWVSSFFFYLIPLLHLIHQSAYETFGTWLRFLSSVKFIF